MYLDDLWERYATGSLNGCRVMGPTEFQEAIREAVAERQEACAKVAELFSGSDQDIAVAIRALDIPFAPLDKEKIAQARERMSRGEGRSLDDVIRELEQ